MRIAPCLAILLMAASVRPSHAQLAAGQGKFLGNVYSSSQLDGFADYWNQVTPENAGKWETTEPQRDQMRWSEMDAAYDLAKSNGFPIRFHVLIWGNQQPAWIETLSTAEQEEEIDEWFAAVAVRYPDLDYVEVVNEPLHDPPNQAGSGGGNYIDALGGTGSTGWDWVLNAFRKARAAFPASTKLMLNDYGIVSSIGSTNQYVDLIQLLQAEGLIDGIGVQAHAFSTAFANESTIQSNLDALAATGLPIQVTEMDIDGSTDAVQWREYERIFPLFWEHPAVEGVTLWGWRPGMWRTEQRAYLVHADGRERFAMTQFLRPYMVTLADIENWEVPGQYRLLGNYPNPFNPQTTIEYQLAAAGTVRLEVYDLLGNRVRTLVDGFQEAATHRAEWNGRDAGGLAVPSGVYVYRLSTAGAASASRRMVLVK